MYVKGTKNTGNASNREGCWLASVAKYLVVFFTIFDILEHLGAQGPQGEKKRAQNGLDFVWI